MAGSGAAPSQRLDRSRCTPAASTAKLVSIDEYTALVDEFANCKLMSFPPKVRAIHRAAPSQRAGSVRSANAADPRRRDAAHACVPRTNLAVRVAVYDRRTRARTPARYDVAPPLPGRGPKRPRCAAFAAPTALRAKNFPRMRASRFCQVPLSGSGVPLKSQIFRGGVYHRSGVTLCPSA